MPPKQKTRGHGATRLCPPYRTRNQSALMPAMAAISVHLRISAAMKLENYGAAGPVNLTNLAGELYKLKAGLDFVAVHFKSGAESLTCVIGDQSRCGLTTSTW